MKFLSPFILLTTLIVSGCAPDATVKPAIDVQQHAQHHPGEKTGACADPNARPSNLCAETISAAFDGKGVLWIAWVNNERLYVQSSLDKGSSFTRPVLVNSKPEAIAAEGESRPKIKLDAQGNIYLTWVLTLDKKRSTYVRFSRSNDGGKHFSAPVTVNDNVEIIRHRFDSLAIGKNGELFIAWLDARDIEAAKKAGQDFKGLSLYYAWSKDGGAHFYPNQRIATHTCECCRLATAIAPDNTPVITWRHIFDGGIRDHALVKFADWNTPGDTHRVGQDNWKIDACPHHGPGLSISATGIYHEVWFSNSPSHQGLFYAYSTDSGRHFSTPLNFGKTGASHPHVLALGSRVHVVWLEFDGSNNMIKLIKSEDDGKSWSQPEVIAQTAQSGDQPFLVSDGDKIYLSWKARQQNYQLVLLE